MNYAHTMTYPEMLKSKEGVFTLQGVLIGGPDRKTDDESARWKNWQKAIQKASEKTNTVPAHVMQYFQATKHLTSPPKAGDSNILQTGPINPALIPTEEPETLMSNPFTPPRFTWSYTSMQEFLTCPAQWAAKRYYKTIKDVESEAMRVGNMIHETAEHYGKMLTGQSFKPSSIHSQYLPVVQKYVDAFVKSGGEIHFERELCFTRELKPCGWRDWTTVWVRAKADVLIKKGAKLSIPDYKTGKYKEDFLQLKMFAVFTALTPGFEDVQEFDPMFIFTKEAAPKNILRLPEPIKRSELKGVLAEILGVVRRMEAAWESENFPCKRNGLCKNYCANTDCTHCG